MLGSRDTKKDCWKPKLLLSTYIDFYRINIRIFIRPIEQHCQPIKKGNTYNEFKLLNKDLNFCPTPRKYNKSKHTKYINDFIRGITLKAQFKTTQSLAKKDVIQFTKSSSEKEDP